MEYRHILSVLLISTASLSAFAVPARKGVVLLRQPDGTEIAASIHGDEYCHYFTTPDGVPLAEDSNGRLFVSDESLEAFMESMAVRSGMSPKRRYAEHRMVPTLKSGEAERRYGLFPGSSFPSVGSPKALVVLVEYSDVKFTLDNPHDYFSRMVNEPGFSDYGGTGSVSDYFSENSCGLFTPDFDVVGPVSLSGTREYYGANAANGDDIRAHMMVVEACRQLDEELDFADYDNDGDGVIDNVFVFYAGEAESSTGVRNQVWPHTAYVSYYMASKVMLDGVELDRYACSNEWNMPRIPTPGGKGRPDGIGTFVHEFSHVLGLPDLYATAYSGAFTPGEWSALDYGPYNNNGCTPPNYSVFERYALGWLSPRVVSGPANVRLDDIAHNQAAMIPTAKDTEFFLFENRQQCGWDEFIPGHGMLIWHVDYKDDVWTMNAVNNTVAHQHVDIEEADGKATDDTRAGDAFPCGGRTRFDDTTLPSMLPWTGKSVNLPVSDITETADGVVTFRVSGGRPEVDVPVANEATDVTSAGFRASWTASKEPKCSYVLDVYSRDDFGRLCFAPSYCNRNVGEGLEHNVTGLRSDMQYYYTVRAIAVDGESDVSGEISVRTSAASFEGLIPEVLDATDIGSTSFTANWKPLDGAVSYLLYVTTPVADGHLSEVCDFSGGLSRIPAGWTTDATSTYGLSANSGHAVPSLRFTEAGQWLKAPVCSDRIYSFAFWMRGVGTAAGDAVRVEFVDAGGTVVGSRIVEAVDAAGGAEVRVDDIPDGAVAVRLVAAHSKGSLAIDDVELIHGQTFSDATLPGYDMCPVFDTSFTVDGLAPSTSYTYHVVALDGASVASRPSALVSLVTASDDASLASVSESRAEISLGGRTVTVSFPTDGEAELFSVDGRLVGKAAGHIVNFDIPAAGVYIIRAGTLVRRILVR